MDKILNYFGYYKVDKDKLLDLYVENLPDMEGEFSVEDEQDLMLRLNNVDGFRKWIQFVVFRDMKNYYVAVNDKQRDNIRGGSQRLLDITKRMDTAKTPQKKVTRISGVRYG